MQAGGDISEMRLAAFRHVQGLMRESGNHVSWDQLCEGFRFAGKKIHLASRPRGIFKPEQMRHVLSIKTVMPRGGRAIWYPDQAAARRHFYEGEEGFIDYSFQGDDPASTDNLLLREACERQTPLIYFLAVRPAVYQPILPVFISDWLADERKAQVVFGPPASALQVDLDLRFPQVAERRYTHYQVKQRLHQSWFREAVMQAYGGRCAITRLPEPQLLDAAHIIPDADEELGQAVVSNGIALSKLHHAAFDRNLLGIDPDYRLHISEKLLDQRDGPQLELLKGLAGRPIHLPERVEEHPDRERLAERFEQYRNATST